MAVNTGLNKDHSVRPVYTAHTEMASCDDRWPLACMYTVVVGIQQQHAINSVSGCGARACVDRLYCVACNYQRNQETLF